MQSYTVVLAPQDLIPQVVGELLSYATDPDLVRVAHGVSGQEIHAHPDVAEAWFTARQKLEEEKEAAPEPAPEPKTRTAKKNTTSA